MEYRGPILLVFGLSLMISPFAISLVEQNKTEDARQVETMGAKAAECAQQTIETSTYVIGCQGRTAATDNRRYMNNGGALFVASRN